MKIRWKLFITYSSLILMILFISGIIFYRYSTGLMRDKGYQSLYQTSLSISDRLDIEMESLDQLATRIIFSDQVSDTWFHNMINHDGTVNQTSVNRLNSAIYSLAGPILQNWEICLYHADGTIATMGMYSGVYLESADTVRTFPLFSRAIDARGSKVFSGPYTNNWNRQDQVLSVSRCFSSQLLSKPTSVVEVQIDYDHMIKVLRNVLHSTQPEDLARMWIMSPDGELLYGEQDDFPDIFSTCLDKIEEENPQNWFSVQNNSDKEKYVASYIQSDYTGWITITALPESILFESIRAFGLWLLVILFFALACTLLVTYCISRNLTRPLEKLHAAIRNTALPYTLPRPEKKALAKSEPEALYDAYMHLTEQLQSSINLTAQMSVREAQARLLALQSQMNPHFLYNTISSISILSEMGDSAKVMQICRLLTDMMGYILSKTKKKNTTLDDEIQFAKQYLDLMKIRYEHYLEWEIDVPEEMRSIPFPKLVLQPLVENCMKYATGGKPPWKICIRGFFTDDRNWRIQVTDNGLGFSESYLTFWNQSKDTDSFQYYEESSDGLGLKNTRSRFRILYPENSVFELSNLPEGGASILIGGTGPVHTQSDIL